MKNINKYFWMGGILKYHREEKSGSECERKSRKLKWDEEALQEAQAELDALERCHPVTEPKTPFVHGVRTPSKSPVREPEDDAESKATKPRSSSWSTTSEEEEEEYKEEEIEEMSESFEEHRKEHYQMRDALKLGRHLIETDDEENE